MEIQNFKMRVTPEQSKIVQETLFANGYYWHTGNDKPGFYGARYLYLTTIYDYPNYIHSKFLKYGHGWRKFTTIEIPELTFQQFKEKYIDDEFVLPKAWYVKANRKNIPYLKEWWSRYEDPRFRVWDVGSYYG